MLDETAHDELLNPQTSEEFPKQTPVEDRIESKGEVKPEQERLLSPPEVLEGVRTLIEAFKEPDKDKEDGGKNKVREGWNLQIERGMWFLIRETEFYTTTITFGREQKEIIFRKFSKDNSGSRELKIWDQYKPYPDSQKIINGFEFTKKERENVAPYGKPPELGGLYGRPHKDTDYALSNGKKLIKEIMQ